MDGSPPSVDTAIQAIRTLYHHKDPNEQEKASKWLQALQSSVHAWKVSDELLHRKLDVESCYFAAQTMRTKIQNSFTELPEDAHCSLRDSLYEHVGSITEDTDHVIVTQLCLALADLLLQMREWNSPISSIIERFGHTRPLALLEVLVVLPEEVNSRHLRLGHNRREEVIGEIKTSSPLVMEFLNACISLDVKDKTNLKSNLFRCLMSWITLGALPLENIQQNGLLVHAFHAIQTLDTHDKVHEAACDAICSLLERLEGLDDANPDIAALELALFTILKRLEEPYHMAVAQEDMDKVLNFCRMFTEFGESTVAKIVSRSRPDSPHFAIGIMDSILLCCGHPDYEVPDITFNFWYRLSEEIYQANNEQLNQLFRPYIERFIAALCRHSQMEPDNISVLEEGEDFSDFRYRVSEAIKDVVFIIGSSVVFKRMFEGLSTGMTSWESTEAALFVMSTVAKNINPDDNETVAPVVESVLALPETTHIAVRLTSLKLIGELGEWFGRHPQFLDRILNWLLVGLRTPILSSEAANALEKICSHGSHHMAPHFSGLIQIIQSLDTFKLKPPAANGLIKGVSVILSKLPHQHIAEALRTLLEFQVNRLTVVMTQNDHMNPQKAIEGDPVTYLDRMATIFRYVTPENISHDAPFHPCQQSIQDVWPVLSQVMERYQANIRIMERCCRTIRFAIRCVGTKSAPLLEPLVKQMVSLYQTHPHSCFLYLGSILVDEFAHVEGCTHGLISMLEAFLPKTFSLLQEQNGPRNHPDTVDDFFRLNVRCIQRIPLAYLQTSFINTIIECGLICIPLDHREANASVMKFFMDLIHSGKNKEQREDFEIRSGLINQMLNQYGARLVDQLLRSTIFNLPSYTLMDVGEVLYEIICFNRADFCKHLENSLKSLEQEGHQQKVTHKQVVSFHKEVTKADDPKEISQSVREFSRLWR